MAPIFTGLAKGLGGFGFGKLSGEAPLGPTDLVIANLSTNSYTESEGVTSSPITLPDTFTKLIVFGVSGGGSTGMRNDGDNGSGGGGGGAGTVSGYEIPFASITGSTITVAVGRGAIPAPSGELGGPYPGMPPGSPLPSSYYTGNTGYRFGIVGY